ncbi:MAG: hypothetical protein JRI25_27150 [Deltaproteobacteria bacterium]|nr:hypothetical protein [Deltaproteobacteria bacterium]
MKFALLVALLSACTSEAPVAAPPPPRAPTAVPSVPLAAEPTIEVHAEPMPALTGHPAHTVRFVPGGTRLAAVGSGGDYTVRVWSVEEQREIARIPIYASGFDIDPSGRFVVMGRKEVATLWDVDRGAAVHDFGGHWDWVEQVAFHPDGERIATYDDSPELRVFDVESGRLIARAGDAGPQSLVRDMTLSSSWLTWVEIGQGSIRRWNLETGEVTGLDVPAGAGRLAQTPDGRWLAATLTQTPMPGKVAAGALSGIWNTETGAYSEVAGVAYLLAFTPDGRVLATVHEDLIRLVDVEAGQLVATTRASGQVTSLAIGADHVLAAAVPSMGEVQLWRLVYE